jgi:hypothetical protein
LVQDLTKAALLDQHHVKDHILHLNKQTSELGQKIKTMRIEIHRLKEVKSKVQVETQEFEAAHPDQLQKIFDLVKAQHTARIEAEIRIQMETQEFETAPPDQLQKMLHLLEAQQTAMIEAERKRNEQLLACIGGIEPLVADHS